MTHLRPLDGAGLARAYYEVLCPTFPAWELKPLQEMQRLAEKGLYRALCLFDGEEALAFAFMWRIGGDYLLLDYFAVPAGKRNCGYGAQLLAALPGYYGKKSVVLIECEAPENLDDPTMARRRLVFYQRCGARLAGFDSALYGMRFRVLALAQGALDGAELLERYYGLYYKQYFGTAIWDSIRIPLPEGERPPEMEVERDR